MVKIRVPATTANIGPGFDCLGCAVDLYAEFVFEAIPSGVVVSGCAPKYCNDRNLAIRAFLYAAEQLGVPVPGIRLTVSSDIPVSRGLGSSAAFIAAGAAAAAALAGQTLPKEQLLKICTALEGHPDNVAPAIYGGLCASMMDEGDVYTAQVPLHPGVRFLALIPSFPLSTVLARQALPKSVELRDAVFNVGHTALLLRALETGDMPLVSAALKDRLHQSYRFPLIAGSEDIVQAAKENAADAVFISGAGPTMMCLYHEDGFADGMAQSLEGMPGGWRAQKLGVDTQGILISALQQPPRGQH